MPKRKSKSTKTRKRSKSMKGDGRALDWLKGAVRDVHNFVKDKKLISRGLSSLATSGLTPYGSQLNKASSFAKSVGYGKRRRRKTRK